MDQRKVTHTRASNLFGTMEKIGARFASMNIFLFFGLLFIYQLSLVFQGVDMLDEGFHATSYQQIFNDPESVQYTFVYWLSDVVGGVVLKLFPGGGMLALRIAGALVSVLTIIVAYRALRNHIGPGVLKLSLVMLALFINNDPKDLYYNNLSALFYVLTAYFLYLGLTKNKAALIFTGGLFVGINMFTRLPNLLAPAIGLAVFYYGFCASQTTKQQFRNFFFFAAGCIVAIGGVVLLMQMLGQLQLFINSIKQLFSISSGAKETDGLNGSYGASNIVLQTIKQYVRSISLAIGVIAIIAISFYTLNHTQKAPRLIKMGIRLAIFIFIAFLTQSMIKDGILDYQLIELFTGMCVAAAFFILMRGKNDAVKLISAMGIFIMLVHPLGSAVGIYTVIPYSMWLIFPFAIDYVAGIRQFSLHMDVAGGKEKLGVAVSERDTRLIKLGGLAIIILTCLVHIVVYPYFYDRHSRLEMTYSIDNKHMHGIYTSEERAASISELLNQSSKYIKPNDHVLAYDLIPLFHFWTETRPYVRNPCPWFYSPSVFEQELTAAKGRINKLPVVVMQTVLTIGDGSKWPEQKLDSDYLTWDRNKGRNDVLNKFLTEHDYTIAWQNDVFRIMIPGTAAAGSSPAVE